MSGQPVGADAPPYPPCAHAYACSHIFVLIKYKYM